MEENTIRAFADQLYKAEMQHRPIANLSAEHPGVTVADAYQIQLAVADRKVEGGLCVVGKKIGLTNLAMQSAMGISEPDFGQIFNINLGMQDRPLSMANFVSPKIEAELAFVLRQDLKGPGITEAAVMAATAGIVASFEVVDSRFTDAITLPDTIADNASCGAVVLGSRFVPIEGLDLRTIGLVLEKNGQVLDFGVSAAVMGSPAASVAWLANKMAEQGIALKAGEVILSGSFTNVHPIAAGDHFAAHFGGVGSVKLSFTA